MSTPDFVHDPGNRQFRLMIDQHLAVVDYQVRDGILYLTHSEVPVALRGHGVGKVLVDHTFEYLQAQGLQARAVCSYIRRVAQRDARWHRFNQS
jgi:predicted GNAT family acetyltransferase